MALICYFCAPENGMGMETILIKAFSFVLIIFGAALLRKAGFFKAGDFSLLSDIVLKITLLLCRYAMALVMGAAFWCLAPFSDEIRKILLVISFAPMSAVCAIFTSRCSGDVAMSCTVNSLSIIISIVFMTLIMIVF